mgnify:FL=1
MRDWSFTVHVTTERATATVRWNGVIVAEALPWWPWIGISQNLPEVETLDEARSEMALRMLAEVLG